MKWQLGALKRLARNEMVPGIALQDAISGIEKLTGELETMRARARRAEEAVKVELEQSGIKDLLDERDAEVKALEKKLAAQCHWSCPDREDNTYWESDCGLTWQFEDDGPKENDMQFCPKCGRHLVVDEPPAEEEEPQA